MGIIAGAIDLAKNVFVAHGVDANGKAVPVRPKLSRAPMSALIAQLPAPY